MWKREEQGLREKQVIQEERERERERERKEREKRKEQRERERGEKGEIRTRKREKEIRVNVSAGGQRWPPHLASQGPRFFAACLASAGRRHEILRTASVA